MCRGMAERIATLFRRIHKAVTGAESWGAALDAVNKELGGYLPSLAGLVVSFASAIGMLASDLGWVGVSVLTFCAFVAVRQVFLQRRGSGPEQSKTAVVPSPAGAVSAPWEPQSMTPASDKLPLIPLAEFAERVNALQRAFEDWKSRPLETPLLVKKALKSVDERLNKLDGGMMLDGSSLAEQFAVLVEFIRQQEYRLLQLEKLLWHRLNLDRLQAVRSQVEAVSNDVAHRGRSFEEARQALREAGRRIEGTIGGIDVLDKMDSSLEIVENDIRRGSIRREQKEKALFDREYNAISSALSKAIHEIETGIYYINEDFLSSPKPTLKHPTQGSASGTPSP